MRKPWRKDEIGILGKALGVVEQLDAPPAASTLLAVPVSGVVDQDAPHRLGRGGEEVPPAVEVPVADQPEVGFMHQRGGIEGVARLLRRHPRSGELPQLLINEREEFGGGAAVARRTGVENLCHFRHERRV